MRMSRRTVLAGAMVSASSELKGNESTPHVALLGDSVLDNGAYVGGGPDVVRQLRSISPAGWRATLLAVDGAMIDGVVRQLAQMPADVTHVVVSAGGNDALSQSAILSMRLGSMSEALGALKAVQDRFRQNYSRMLDAVAARKARVAACTIYDPRFPGPQERALAATALSVLNDTITRELFRRSLTLIDLRVLLNDDADFANPIEPSERGGMKIATAIKRFVAGEVGAGVLS